MKDLLVFLARGFEEIEALTVVDLGRRAGLDVDTVSIYHEREVKGAHDITVLADYALGEVEPENYRGLYIPGGLPGAENLRDKDEVVIALRRAKEDRRITAAICAGPTVLDRGELLRENQYTCYPGVEEELNTPGALSQGVVKDETVITAMGPAFSMDMALTLIDELAGEEKAREVGAQVLYPQWVEERR